MNAYLPSGFFIVAGLAGTLVAVVAIGFLLQRHASGDSACWIAWGMTVLSVAGIERFTSGEPAGFRMVAIIVVLLYAMKSVVAVESRLRTKPPLPLSRWLGFCLLWFGMRPDVFRKPFHPHRPDFGSLLISGVLQMALGAGLIAVAVAIGSRSTADRGILLGLALLMVGISFLVHFGLFDLLTAVWRWLGADCPKLFRAPILSRNLTEFWSRRWNIAFSEMAAIAVFRPAKRRLGPTGAKTAAFLFSGLLHELAISVPVKAGFGLPFCYFLLHAFAMHLETTQPVRRALESRLLSHVWTAAWILIPIPLLFHRPFCEGVLLPLISPGSSAVAV